MRVAVLVSQYPAPSHTFIRREVDALRRHGVEVVTFALRAPKPEERANERDEQAFQSTRYVLPMSLGRLIGAHAREAIRRPPRYLATLSRALTHRVPGAKALAWGLFHFAEAIVLARELEAKEVEHLHNHFANAGANVGYLAAHHLGLGWSLTLHGLSDFDYPSRLLLPEKVAKARFAICVSYFGKGLASLYLKPAEWEKVVLGRCGVDLAAIPPRRSRTGGRLRIVTVGRLAPEKGQLGLIEAFAKIVARGVDAELRIIGDGPLRSALEQRVEAHGLGDRCTFTGRKSEPEVLAEMAEADVFALASFMEGLPVVLMEALALELAVVAPRVAGIPEIIEHDQTGLLFTPGRWDELEGEIARLLASPELRSRLGSAGRRRVVAEFDIDLAVQPLLRKLSESVGSRS